MEVTAGDRSNKWRLNGPGFHAGSLWPDYPAIAMKMRVRVSLRSAFGFRPSSDLGLRPSDFPCPASPKATNHPKLVVVFALRKPAPPKAAHRERQSNKSVTSLCSAGGVRAARELPPTATTGSVPSSAAATAGRGHSRVRAAGPPADVGRLRLGGLPPGGRARGSSATPEPRV